MVRPIARESFLLFDSRLNEPTVEIREPSVFKDLIEEAAKAFDSQYSESEREMFIKNFYIDVMDLFMRENITTTREDVKSICFYILHAGSHTEVEELSLLRQLYTSGVSEERLREVLKQIVPETDYDRWTVLERHFHSLEIRGN